MKSNNIYQVGILLIACLLPSGLYSITLAVPIVLILYQLAVTKDHKKILATGRQPRFLLPFLFYFLTIAGFFFSDNRREALSSLSIYIPFVVFPLFFLVYDPVNEKIFEKIERFFAYSTCISLLLAILYAAYDVLRTSETTLLIDENMYNKFTAGGLTRIYPNWHPTYAALFANHAIYILLSGLAARFKRQNSFRNICDILALVILATSIFLLNSITGIAILIVIFSYFFVRMLKLLIKSVIIRLAFPLLILAALASFFYFNPLKIEKLGTLKSKGVKITDKQEERNILTIRLAKWESHLVVIKDHFLFGTTNGDIKDERKKVYQLKGYHDLALYNYNAHNEYLEVFARYGIIGFVLFMSLFLFPLYMNTKAYLPFFFLVFIVFITESVLERQQGLNYFIFFYMLYSQKRTRQRSFL